MEKFIKVFVNSFYMPEIFIQYGIHPSETELTAFLERRGLERESETSQTYISKEGETVHVNLDSGFIMVKTEDPLDREFVEGISRIVNYKRITNVGSEEIRF